ncbi:MAG: CoF synthetase [Rhodopirellula sp.]|nr:CoF synthetase [Rhodopirellula sp.]MAI73610.1 CoF synthetase [Rhodopirellula sp.]
MQLKRLNELLLQVRDRPFYAQHELGARGPLNSLHDLASLPLLTKEQLLGEAAGRPARVFDLPRIDYTRLHQTSGTKGFPMTVLDTPADWAWWLNCWDYVLDAAEVEQRDVAMMAFSFGPFIGFWTANDALVRRGTTVVPGGGMTSQQRIQMIFDHRCSLLCCTPTYALHLGAVADKHDIDLTKTAIRRIIVAGEPGGSTPSVRNRLETLWGAKVIDHTGASEVGAWGFGNSAGTGIHVIEDEFIAELLRFDIDHPAGIGVEDGEQAELVLTSLGRFGGPVIRYRTGDIVCGYRNHDQECGFLFLDGGVLGRVDDMMVIRGVNVFPSSIESMVREITPLAEFRMIISRVDEMDQLAIELESDQASVAKLSDLIRDRLAMRVSVDAVAVGSLPRFEAKAKRLVDLRKI